MNKRLIIISALVAALALYLTLFPFMDSVPLRKGFAEFPLRWNGWSGRTSLLDARAIDILKMSEYMMRGYRKGNDDVSLYIGYYGTQRGGAQIHSPKLCLPAAGWVKESEKTEFMDVEGFGRVNFVQAVYRKDSQAEVFIYWYQMKGAYITDEYKLRLYRFLNSLRYRRNDAAFVRISAPVTTKVEDTVYLMDGFMKDFLPTLKEYLPE